MKNTQHQRQPLMAGSSVLLLVLLLIWPVTVQPAAGLSADTVKQIEALIESEKIRLKLPSLQVAIAVDNQLQYAKGFGLADLENSVPAKATTLYRTASIAKPITAVAVMQLVEQGKIDLDAPIQKYCASFSPKPWPVTTRQVLGHLGGVRHYQSAEEARGTKHYFSLAEAMKLFQDDPLVAEPGTKYNYTTFGYTVLGCAIEGVTGQRYEEYLRQHVFQPAGMERTQVDEHYLLITDRARGYQKLSEAEAAQLPSQVRAQFKVGDIFNAGLHDTSMKIPGGGLLSTAADLVRFALAVQSGKLVKPATRDEMWTSLKLKDGKETNYGLGWGVGRAGQMKRISHGGNQAGARSDLTLVPEKGIVIAVMTNLESAPLEELVNGIGKILMGPVTQ